VKDRPIFDRLEQPIVPEYAARLAEFKAGNIWPSVASQSDVLRVKKELPDTLLQKFDGFSTVLSTLAFGYAPEGPWKDERLRQAVSLLLDREAFVEMGSHVRKLSSEVLPVEVRYHSVVAAGWEDYWIDPTNVDKFGPNARYYTHDPAEARSLLEAAGFPEGLDSLIHYNGGGQYGPLYARTAEIVSGMLSAGGIRAQLDPRDYQNDWLPNYYYGYAASANAGKPIKGFGGLAFRPGVPYATAAAQIFSTMHKDGTRFLGMTSDGLNPQLGDPEVQARVDAIRREYDVKKQQALVQDFARFMARKAYVIPVPPYASLFYTLSWPVIANLGVYTGWPAGGAATETALHYWIDPSKPPLAQTS